MRVLRSKSRGLRHVLLRVFLSVRAHRGQPRDETERVHEEDGSVLGVLRRSLPGGFFRQRVGGRVFRRRASRRGGIRRLVQRSTREVRVRDRLLSVPLLHAVQVVRGLLVRDRSSGR